MLTLPYGFLSPAAGGGLIPVGGYLAYIDFAENAYLTFDVNSNIETASDISGNGYNADRDWETSSCCW